MGPCRRKRYLRIYLSSFHPYTGEGRKADLVVSEDPVEITDWNQLPNFSATEDTQMLVNSELHYMVLDRGTRYWKVHAAIELDNLEGLLRKKEVNGKSLELPTLYDLVMMEEPGRYLLSVDLQWNDHQGENEIRIFSDTYNDPSPALDDRWKNRPLLIQTAACGPPGVADKKPPYSRKIEIEGGDIKGFKIGRT
jgi:hypothetical protein